MPFTIESGIPVPDEVWDNFEYYPFSRMKMWDSFLIPCSGGVQKEFEKQQVAEGVKDFLERNPRHRFVFATVADGVRVWRVRKN